MDMIFEVYFKDLNPKAQKEFLKFSGLKSAKEGQYDIFPITIVYKGDIFGDK